MKKNSPKKNQKNRRNREFSVITGLFLAAFFAMIAYLVFYLAVRSQTFVNNPYNKRIDTLSEKTLRGPIYAADNSVLAYTAKDAYGADVRIYPYGAEYAHVVGYTGNGKLGLEAAANFYLLHSHSALPERIRHAFTGEQDAGDGILTTLEPAMQDAAYRALGSYRGAIIVMEPESGKVLALVSKPDFDPNTIALTYDSLAADDTAATLVNRATQGRYAPGSTFKLLTTLAYVHENPTTYEAYTFDCTGSFLSDGKEIHCYNNTAHGLESLEDSFTHSCNSSYASLSLGLDTTRFTQLCDSMLFNQKISFDLPTEKSRFAFSDEISDAERMETAIGQGKTLATPLQMLLITAAVDRGGTVHAPYLMEESVNDAGNPVELFAPTDTLTLMSAEDATLMRSFMRSVVTDGTGRGLNTDRYTAYGKTGTAEYNSAGDSHAWFIGFAEQEGKPDIAIAVIMEGAGAGSSFAVPAAKIVFDAYFQ